jgi:hypothetical protein
MMIRHRRPRRGMWPGPVDGQVEATGSLGPAPHRLQVEVELGLRVTVAKEPQRAVSPQTARVHACQDGYGGVEVVVYPGGPLAGERPLDAPQALHDLALVGDREGEEQRVQLRAVEPSGVTTVRALHRIPLV